MPQDEKEFQEAKGFDLKVLFELDPSPERLTWLMGYMDFMASRGTPLTHCPAMYKVRVLGYKRNKLRRVHSSCLHTCPL